jgi:hypothetical protein
MNRMANLQQDKEGDSFDRPQASARRQSSQALGLPRRITICTPNVASARGAEIVLLSASTRHILTRSGGRDESERPGEYHYD